MWIMWNEKKVKKKNQKKNKKKFTHLCRPVDSSRPGAVEESKGFALESSNVLILNTACRGLPTFSKKAGCFLPPVHETMLQSQSSTCSPFRMRTNKKFQSNSKEIETLVIFSVDFINNRKNESKTYHRRQYQQVVNFHVDWNYL